MGVQFPPGALYFHFIFIKNIMVWLVIFALIFFAFFIFFVVQFYNIIFRGYAPFVSTQPKVVAAVVRALKIFNIRDDPVVYELGCGRAGVLAAIGRAYPKAKLVGVEYSFLPYLLARWQNGLRASKIKVIKADIFKVRLWEADVIYCYLNA